MKVCAVGSAVLVLRCSGSGSADVKSDVGLQDMSFDLMKRRLGKQKCKRALKQSFEDSHNQKVVEAQRLSMKVANPMAEVSPGLLNNVG